VKISVEEYQRGVTAVAFAMRLIGGQDIPKLLEAIEQAHALGPVLDPTLYRDKVQAMGEDKRILEAGLPLWKLCNELMKKRAEVAGAQRAQEGPHTERDVRGSVPG
jgi:hypothetical protein